MPQVAAGLSLERSRAAQADWACRSVRDRLRIIRRLRDTIARHASELLDAFPSGLRRSRTDSLTAEVIPLAEACRYLELEAEAILCPQTLPPRGRPPWLSSVHVEVRREPFGVVLIVGPANYPLFLTGVQTIQALTAGNAVIVKPGRGGDRLTEVFARFAYEAGLPAGLVTVLDESIEAAREAMSSGIDKVVLTGSAQTGRVVLRDSAERLIPAIAELSGEDPVFVQAGADLKRAAQCVTFGRNLNRGETCIAPRRVYVHRSVFERFVQELPRIDIPVTPVNDDDEALLLASQSPYALGATIFGDERNATKLAERIRAGVVVVNDMIVPTADPRVSFGGRGASGYGTTRGALGLLEMTTPKTVIVQRGQRLRHLEKTAPNSEEFFLSYLSAFHTQSVGHRMQGWLRFAKAISRLRKVNL